MVEHVCEKLIYTTAKCASVSRAPRLPISCSQLQRGFIYRHPRYTYTRIATPKFQQLVDYLTGFSKDVTRDEESAP